MNIAIKIYKAAAGFGDAEAYSAFCRRRQMIFSLGINNHTSNEDFASNLPFTKSDS